MSQVLNSNVILVLILAISIISKNNTLAIAVCCLLLISLIGKIGGGFEEVSKIILEKLEKYGLKFGIIILIIGIMSPLALGKYNAYEIINIIKSKEGIISILCGCIVSLLAGRGGMLLENDPRLVLSLVFGTIIGIIFFKGYPIGPLVGGGIVVLITSFINIFK